MGQDKKQLEQLLQYIEHLYKNPGNKEFAAGIHRLVSDSIQLRSSDSEKINDIYEMCLEHNARVQAIGLYSKFPYPELLDSLVEDFVIMERFRRRSDLQNYAAHLFLQIENICNRICSDPEYQEAYRKLLKANPDAYITTTREGKKVRYQDNKKTKMISILFGSYTQYNNQEKKDLLMSKLANRDKMKCVLYFGGYGTQLPYSEFFTDWKKHTDTLEDIYVARCSADHRGQTLTESQQKRYDAVMAEKDYSFSKFFYHLVFFVNKITEGYDLKRELIEFANSFDERVEDCIVTIVHPGTIFVKNSQGSVCKIDYPICGNTDKYHIDQQVRVTISHEGKVNKIEIVEK